MSNPFVHEKRKYFCESCGSEIASHHGWHRARRRGYGFCSLRCSAKGLALRAAEDLPMRLMSRIELRGNDECWPFHGRTTHGYGIIDFNGRPALAHRLMFQLMNSQDPGDLFVCHSCDNPICCNPNHLWLGTHKDNMRDMRIKGRSPHNSKKGVDHPSAKLSESDVREIRISLDAAYDLAKRYGVTREQINNIRLRKAWRHV